MAKQKEAYGKKLLYRYSGGLIFSIFINLLVIGAFVASIFLPYVNLNPSVMSDGLTGLELIKIIYHLFTNEPNTMVNAYVEHIAANVFDGFGLAAPIINIYLYIMVASYLIMGLCAFILFIGTLVMLFSGRLKNWKFAYGLSSKVFGFSVLYFGSIIGLNLYSGWIKVQVGLATTGLIYDALYSYILFGSLLLLVIINHIIYSVAFKNHVYVKNEATLKRYIEEYEKENVIVDTSEEHKEEEVVIQKAPKIEVKPMPDQTSKNESSDNRKKLPKGLKHIGGHAFSQNTVLEEADIPLGIEILGAGAFANCVNLKVVHIPESVKKIEYNCFFNCIRLERITYGGSREMWKRIKRGSNWLTAAGTNFVVCRDGAIAVNPEK